MTAFIRALLIGLCISLATGMALTGQSCSRLNGGSLTLERSSTLSGRACAPPRGISGAPRSIEQVVALINSLPRPVTLACFLEALERPLHLYASQSSASVQPSSGPTDPRFFVFSLPLIMTVTTEGPGVDRLLMSVLQPGNAVSTKAELEFPIGSEVALELPFARVFTGSGTSCGSCHTNERPDPSVSAAAAYSSAAFKPLPTSEVSLSFLESQSQLCDPLQTPDRCLLLRVLFTTGPVLRADFPVGMVSP